MGFLDNIVPSHLLANKVRGVAEGDVKKAEVEAAAAEPISYVKVSPTTLKRSDEVYIPINPMNKDYQAYLEWVAQGNTPPEYSEPIARKLAVIRHVKNLRLRATDWVLLPDALEDLTQLQIDEVITYRAQVRLAVVDKTDIKDVTWPAIPSFLE